MDEQPLVSIIVPSYNHEKYIEHCLQSIIGQSYNNIELLIVDDGSQDTSFEIIEKKAEELEKALYNVIILRNDCNLGITKTLNKAIALAQGKYIKIIASDDLLLCDAIEKMVVYYEKNQECDIIYTNVYIGNENTIFNSNNKYDYECVYERSPQFGRTLFHALLKENFIAAVGVMFLRDTFSRYGLFDEDIAIEDWEYWLRISRKGKIGYIGIITAVYRISDNSITHYQNCSNGEEKFIYIMENEMKIITKYKKDAGMQGTLKICRYALQRLRRAMLLDYQKSVNKILEYVRKNGFVLFVIIEVFYILFGIRDYLHAKTKP